MFSRTFLSVRCSLPVTSNFTCAQKLTRHSRSLHLGCRNLRQDLVIRTRHSQQYRAPIVTATFVRYKSDDVAAAANSASSATQMQADPTAVTTPESDLTETIGVPRDFFPEIPEAPTALEKIVDTVVVEPTYLQSLGLGSNWPPGLIQQALDYMHTSMGLPWWASIALFTVCIRTALFPLVIKIQRSSARMHNIQPKIQYINEQLADARKMGDQFEIARCSNELYNYMKDNGVNPIKTAALPMLQAPIFMSFFIALRGMMNAPVESLKTGGLYWFTDLTVADPYYILPLVTSATLFVTLELGVDTLRAETLGNMRYVMRAVPVIIFPFTMNFGGALLCYWVTSNTFSLVQVGILQIPAVRKFFKIPMLVKHDKQKLAARKKKFTEGFKDSWKNMQVARDMKSREHYDQIVFEKAGKGPIPKTYKYDPTQPHPLTKAILAKKSN